MAASRWQREGDAQVDDQFVAEWVAFGLAEIEAWLAKCAAFWRWCLENNREETP